MDNMRRIGLYTAMTLALGLATGAANGDTLLVETVAADSGVAHPDRGMTMDGVLQRYGEPALRAGPVGEPPISTWDYGDFVVYFENQYVIHSVVPHKRP
jgi:hypothetical protein